MLGRAACGVRQWKMITSPGSVAGGRPAGLDPAERARRPGRAEVAAGPDGQAADPDRDVHQRDPARQHVLDAGHPVVVVDVPAARAGPAAVPGRRHAAPSPGRRTRPARGCARTTARSGGRYGRRLNSALVIAARKAGSASASIELTARGWIDGMPRSSTHPPARSRARTARPAAWTSPARQQAAEEQVPVRGQAPAQPIRIIHLGHGVGQLLHTFTISTAPR